MRLFNQQKKKALANSKMSKYLIYAVGEILIVIIGIFIAIQLNNWNENRKTKNRIVSVFNEIEANLEANHRRVKPVIAWYEERDSLIQLVKQHKLTQEDYLKNEELLTLINFYREIQLEKSGYLKLKNYMEDIPEAYDSIIPGLNVLYNQIVPMTERYALVMENFNHRMHERWAKNYVWFSEPRAVTNKEARIAHFLNNPEYLNDVKLYAMYSKDSYVVGLKYVEKFSEKLLELLNEVNLNTKE